MMKRILVVAALAISTLALSAPAHAIDPGTAIAMQMVGGLFKNVGHVNNRRACRSPYIVINHRCVPPHMARRGFYPPTYLPPNIPGSPGYTGQVYSKSESVGGRREEHTCKIKGAVYVEQIGGCVRSVRDVTELQRIVPDLAVDPECRGKPPGFRFDREVTGLRGERGIDHRVCGSRPGR